MKKVFICILLMGGTWLVSCEPDYSGRGRGGTANTESDKDAKKDTVQTENTPVK